VAHKHLEFSLALHRALAPAADHAFCWSPYSVASALGLAASATAGETRAELAAALRESGDGVAELLALLGSAAELGPARGAEQPVLAVANTLWVGEELTVRDSFRHTLRDWPGNAIRGVPFRSAPEQARQQINSDVSDTTRGLIRELLAPGAITAATLAALVNAVYLKVAWQEPFNEAATADKAFHAPGGTRDVRTMHATRRCGYAASQGWQVVSLSAVGDVEAVILLPDGDLADAEPSLDGRSLTTLLSSVAPQRIELFLPSFEVRGQAELPGPLALLGVRTLFTSDADFSPLTDTPLEVSTAVHEAVLRVDEQGLEGAAATAMVMRTASLVRESQPIRVDVDRPFLFLVRHKESGVLYFVARVVAPG
jgi:serine protease inhibitor